MHEVIDHLKGVYAGLKVDPRRWDQKLGIVPNILSLARLVFGLRLVLSDLPRALDDDRKKGLRGGFRATDLVVMKLILVFGTDFVNGKSARSLNAETKFGTVLDTIIDKIVVILLMWVLWRRSLIPCGMLVMFIMTGREGLMVVAKPYIKKQYGVEMQVKQSGKEKMFAQCAAIILLVSTRTRGPVADLAIGIATTLTATSLKDYYYEYRRIVVASKTR